MNTITIDQAQDIEDALNNGFEIESANVRYDYLGRAMYGVACFAVTIDGVSLATAAAYVGATLTDIFDPTTASRMLIAMRSDNMGLGHILYFPGWTVAVGESASLSGSPR